MFKSYKINKSTLNIIKGSITENKSDVIVKTIDTNIIISKMDDLGVFDYEGLAGSILLKGIREIFKDMNKHIPAEVGNIIVTSAGDLKSKYIFHSVTFANDKLLNNITKFSGMNTAIASLKKLEYEQISLKILLNYSINLLE